MALSGNDTHTHRERILSREGALGESHLFMDLPGHVTESAVAHGHTRKEDTPVQPLAP